MIQVFKTWGVPKYIKVDNGRPFGDPQLDLIPPMALWLIGLGIKVIWNRPATPQDNAKVERMQGVMAKWTEYKKCEDTFALQTRLWREADFYNYHFPNKRHRNTKLIERFPTMRHTGKNWNPDDFKLKRVLIFIKKGNWERKVSSTGQVSLYGQLYYVGVAYKHQIVNLKLEPIKNVWSIFDNKGGLIRQRPAPFSVQSIWNIDLS